MSNPTPAPDSSPDRPALPRRPKPRTLAPNLQEALAARDALADALTRAGIQLPAMDVRTPWGDALPDEPEGAEPADAAEEAAPDDRRTPLSARYALVHLGVCSAPVAFALAAVIARGAAR
ncbi:hypothetical protein ACFOOM_18460 [Streptomyces echinoruber]|uniref:Uncharacterized protein n=1 Tax=Streptomyces echinoruber TaxID=68898 RepID=A0A918R7V2_9ACTN|nr:hypothetical protein [Streptomyces echinoruber]GGZ87969.1 hypothetical protein GCM10010389_27740 [Streptomyces echinoruber]